MLVGYARVSTEEQNEARQIKALQEQGAEKIFTDKRSGKNIDRKALKEMLDYVREGDTVITESISRIARSTRDLLSIIDLLNHKKVNFISIKERIDTTTPQGKFMLTVFAAMAELERENILQRQKEGIEIAKEQGKYKGKPPIRVDYKAFAAIYTRWKGNEITAVQAMKSLGLKPNTFYRRVKEYEQKREADI